MMPAVRFSVLSLLTATVLLPAPLSAAETYRNEEGHFSIEFPRGWVRMSADELNDHYEADREVMLDPKARYVVGFRPESVEPGEFPYILVAVGPGPPNRTSFRDIERSMVKAMPAAQQKARKALGESVKLTTDPPVFDRTRARVVLHSRLDAEDVGRVRRVVSLHFGDNATVVVACFAMEDNYERRKTAFEMVTDSVKFDPGHEFRERAGLSSAERGGAAFYATSAVLVVGLIVWLITKPSRSRRRPRRGDDRRAQYEYDRG